MKMSSSKKKLNFYRRIILTKPKIIILMYHRINNLKNINGFFSDVLSTSPANFERQIKFISKNFRVILLRDIPDIVKNKKIKNNYLAITFDDGYKDNYDHAFYIMEKHKVKGTFFICPEYISSNKIYWWDEISYIINNNEYEAAADFISNQLDMKLKKTIPQKLISSVVQKVKYFPIKKRRYFISSLKKRFSYKNINNNQLLRWENIIEMERSGMEIGAHTNNHSILSTLNYQDQYKEINKSKEILKKKIKKKIKSFSYPNGKKKDFNEKTINILKDLNFKCAATTIVGKNDFSTSMFNLKRIPVSYTTNGIKLRMDLKGYLDFPRKIKESIW
ncbi:polysaccharide deacetylase family protein [Candidatus Woesearchaeota archaeon]|nr:polysaccharide deacetylase family protein [Candidatus Woesearchaeota archaeon]